MVLRYNGLKVLWCHGFIGLFSKPQHRRTREPKNHRTIEPQNRRTAEPMKNIIPLNRKFMKKIFPTVLFFTLFSITLFSQKSSTIEGIVADSLSTPLMGATVVLLQAQDSVLSSFGITDLDGRFLMKKVPHGSYILQITYLGYANYSEAIELTAEKGDQDFGKVVLEPASANLDEILVKAEHIPMQIRNDTLEYNAAAFKTQPGSVVEDLLKKLPGVEVARDGSIKAQGETVESVMVDGKEFFGTDPKIATKNLPADIVDKVQVFDKKSDMAEFSGIDDGQEQKTINLSLKDGKKQGYFGNVTGGYGTMDRFESKFNVNRFSKNMQLSALGMGNNVNEQGFSINDYIQFMGGLQNMMSGGGGGGMSLSIGGNSGVPLGMSLNDGFVTSWAGGVNFNYDISDKTELQSSYFYNRLQTEREKTLNRVNLLDDRSFNSDEISDQNSRNTNHRLNLTLKHELDSMQNLVLRSNFGFNDATLKNLSSGNTFNSEGGLENTTFRDYFTNGNNFNANANLIYKRKFNKIGRFFSANASFGVRENELDASLNSINSFLPDDIVLGFSDSLFQRQAQLNDQMNYGIRVSYTEPLGKSKYLEVNYSHQNYENQLIKDFYDILDPATQQEVQNMNLSNHYNRDYIYDRAGMNLKINKKKYQISPGLSWQRSTLTGDLVSGDTTIERSFTRILPSLRTNFDFSAGKSLSFDYSTRIQEPSLEQLQPIIDNSDPLNIYIGNPDLKAEYANDFMLHLMSFDQFTFTSIFAAIRGTYTTDKITNSRSIDSLFRQTITPINVKNDFRVNGYLSFSTPLKFIKSKINLNTNVTYNRGILFVNDSKNNTDRYTTSVDLSIENRKKDVVDIVIGGIWSHNITKYSESTNLNQTFLNQTYYADFNLNLGEKWIINSTVDYNLYSNESFANEDDVAIWKAGITRYILKNRKGRIKLSVYDILNQNLGINRSSEFNFIQEERVRSLGRYFMLSFSYSISGFGSNDGGMKVEVSGRGRR